ncbi:cilia- and flagella-associated protein HOATZ isoform X3 [Protopterus annectens]|uniref:cilia- and flagella-associated protein HOATZ isoform X3 n=1 Tax=Protopterus annectens TaxID=7888 RepID=UPI001CF9C4B1|nr:cilia- and flagella-associated protein HOATZ isoform X3 [Protopterus annectens]
MSEIQSTAEEPGELPDFEKYYLLFAGSSEEDVEFAKAFWNSVALHPPLESRLVSADIKQRLRVAQPHPSQPQRNFAHEPQAIEIKTVQLLLEAHRKQKIEEKSQYLEKSSASLSLMEGKLLWPWYPNLSFSQLKPSSLIVWVSGRCPEVLEGIRLLHPLQDITPYT